MIQLGKKLTLLGEVSGLRGLGRFCLEDLAVGMECDLPGLVDQPGLCVEFW